MGSSEGRNWNVADRNRNDFRLNVSAESSDSLTCELKDVTCTAEAGQYGASSANLTQAMQTIIKAPSFVSCFEPQRFSVSEPRNFYQSSCPTADRQQIHSKADASCKIEPAIKREMVKE